MKKLFFVILLPVLLCLLAGCRYHFFIPEPPYPPVVVITVVVTAEPYHGEEFLPTPTPGGNNGPIILATAPLNPPEQYPAPTITPVTSEISPVEPTRRPTQTFSEQEGRLPTLVPDYQPGQGMAVLTGSSPYTLYIMPGGWQAYQIGSSADAWGYLVDVNPLGPAPQGAYIESRILPEYFSGQWVDVLWIKAPGILRSLPVSVDLITTQGWNVTYENHTKLVPGEWTGWGMFDTAEGCGGVLDISPDDVDQSNNSAFIQNTRVQPEFPGNWIQVIRVQLSNQASGQNAWLRYYAPGSLGIERLDKEATLLPGVWNGFPVASSYIRQGYVVEVIPQKKADNEIAFAVVRPEVSGEGWMDVLRVFVPEGRPSLDAVVRVLAVKVPGQ